MIRIKVNLRMMFLLIASFMFYYLQGGYIATGFFFSILCLFILASFVDGINYFTMKFTVYLDESIYFSCDEIKVRLKIENRSFLSIPYIIVKRHMIEETLEKHQGEALSLGANREEILEYKIKFYHRGVYDLEDFEISISDYFNIFTIRRNEKSHKKVTVYPKIYHIEKDEYLGGINLLETQSTSDTSIEDMHDVREMRKYVYGDNVKRINWKLSAKAGELIVKSYNYKSGKECLIFLDMNKENYTLDSKGIMEEHLVDFTESIINNFNRSIDSYKLYINNYPSFEREINSNKDIEKINQYFLQNKSCGDCTMDEYMRSIIDERFLGRQFIIIIGKVTKEFINSLNMIKVVSKHLCIFYLVAEENLKKKLKEDHIEAFNINLVIKENKILEGEL